MDSEEVEQRYLKRNKVLCRIVGIWPFQSNISRTIVQIWIASFVSTSIYTQVARIVVFFSLDILMEQIPFILAEGGIVLKLINYRVNREKLEGLIKSIYSDWGIKRAAAEVEIMDVYGKRGVLVTLAYIVTSTFGTISFVMLPLTAIIVGYFNGAENGTMRQYIYPAYYPLDEDKYYTYFFIHMSILIATVGTAYCACDSVYMYAVQHACGLLAIAGFIQEVHELHSTYLAFLFVIMIIAFSVTLVKTSLTEIGFEFYKYCGFLVIQLVHLFFVTSQGQFVQNAYNDIYDAMYDGLWYNSSRKTQMLYLLALRGALTAPDLTAGGLLPLTLSTFAEVLKASMSYFTVLKSQ